MNFRFSRNLRLLNADQFQSVFNGAELKASDRNILLLANPNHAENSRIGLVVGKKKIKLAVDRNKFKRVARESFRLHQHNLSGMDIIILPRAGISKIPSSELHKSFRKLWKILEKKNLKFSDSKPQ